MHAAAYCGCSSCGRGLKQVCIKKFHIEAKCSWGRLWRLNPFYSYPTSLGPLVFTLRRLDCMTEIHRKFTINTLFVMPNRTYYDDYGGKTSVYVVRHGEREDNVNRLWRLQHYKLSRLEKDDSPLSERGVFQAEECAYRFSKTHFDHVFSSPFDRCMETTARILGGRRMKIKVEPGFSEILCMCSRPAGFRDVGALRKIYVNVDVEYEPVFQRSFLNYDYERVRHDSVCLPRVSKTLRRILNNYSGSILIVSHGAIISAIHKMLTGKWCSVGQATVSKFTEIDSESFVCEYSGDASHLADRTNLRAF